MTNNPRCKAPRVPSSRRPRDLRRKRERGAIVIFATLSLIFLTAMIGLALDAGQMYVTRLRAQAAADAAAQAGAMDMYNAKGNGTAGATSYATMNGFTNGVSATTVAVSYPSCSAQSWCNGHVTLSSVDSPNLIEVNISRVVNTTFMRVLGVNNSTVSARADAAIAIAPAPIPILVLHPHLSPSFSVNGTKAGVTICGGPTRSFQVNSDVSPSVVISGNASTDLSHAGPNDPGTCLGTGAEGGDFANVAPQPQFAGLALGANGHYFSNASVIRDPYLTLAAPAKPTFACTPATCSVSYTAATGVAHGCPTNCTVYSPGDWSGATGTGGISVSGFAVFRPGIYYLGSGGFSLLSNSIVRMAQALTDQSDPHTATGWSKGVLFYNSSTGTFDIKANSGQISNKDYPDATACGTNPTTGAVLGGNCFVGGFGTPGITTYGGMFFFQNRSVSTTMIHTFSGGSGLSVKGTIYATHTAASILGDGKYQGVSFEGGSGQETVVQGEVITDVLSFGGNSSLKMNLSSTPVSNVRQVALVR